MSRFQVKVRWSTDGRNWGCTIVTVTADSEYGAERNALGQFSHYPYKEVIAIRRV